jgi:hypothetical protein
MPKAFLLVMPAPVPGKEDERNDWYTKVHVRELIKVPAIAATQRFRRSCTDKAANVYGLE